MLFFYFFQVMLRYVKGEFNQIWIKIKKGEIFIVKV